MQQWEYKVVQVRVLDIGDIVKHRKDVPLDPEIDYWLGQTQSIVGKDLGRVAWSDRGCWTTMSQCLQELGQAGWELVGPSPPIAMHFGNRVPDDIPMFEFLLKRPRVEG